MNRHRKAVYSIRREILMGEDISDRVKDLLTNEVKGLAELPAKLNPQFAVSFESVIPLEGKTLKTIEKEEKDKAPVQKALDAGQKLNAAKEKDLRCTLVLKVYTEGTQR